MNDRRMLPPGSWIGILGGGQLGRMITHAAQRMGYHVIILDPEEDCPAAQAADRHVVCPTDDSADDDLIESFARRCDVVTLEFENVAVDVARKAGRFAPIHPRPEILETCQDRLREKNNVRAAGFATAPFRSVTSWEECQQAGEELGFPLVLKTVRSGYDGKGQVTVRAAEQLDAAWAAVGDQPLIAEKWIPFTAEVSMLVARNLRGQIQTFPLLENEHANHILDVTRCPVSADLRDLEEEARRICTGLAEEMGLIGLMCVEMFVDNDGHLLVNEIAPRPHNSGHLTIEAFQCSQFEMAVRAVCNLPLVKPEQWTPAAMANLLGDLWDNGPPDWEAILAHANVHLHLYGKAEPRPGRKMGHVTVLDATSSEAAITARELREAVMVQVEEHAS
ncbi:MAG: N5-carboxyaminoimidazole ribonucleotide synthase [Pirellulaceae bacterium]|nr:MAG: N5-carboxyaminoimidazole ribonucleotide synthase [Pirellulaceae bacterium]